VRVCGYEALEGGIGVDADGRITSVAYCPVGIDAERTERDLQKPTVQPKIEALRQLYKGKKIIVGRDKLDWTKGVLPKVSVYHFLLALHKLTSFIQMEAFEAFLKHYPEWQGKVVMIQVTEPAPNESAKMSTKLSRYVDHINVSAIRSALFSAQTDTCYRVPTATFPSYLCITTIKLSIVMWVYS